MFGRFLPASLFNGRIFFVVHAPKDRAKLEGKHWMYKDSKRRIDLVKMCADCRVQVAAEENFDPFGSSPRQG
jgi:hypothetical protein